jgi:hypothetical protein
MMLLKNLNAIGHKISFISPRLPPPIVADQELLADRVAAVIGAVFELHGPDLERFENIPDLRMII